MTWCVGVAVESMAPRPIPLNQVMRLRTLADEVSRVSLEVGSKGLLGRVAHVPDVEGVWAEMTSNVNRMWVIWVSPLPYIP